MSNTKNESVLVDKKAEEIRIKKLKLIKELQKVRKEVSSDNYDIALISFSKSEELFDDLADAYHNTGLNEIHSIRNYAINIMNALFIYETLDAIYTRFGNAPDHKDRIESLKETLRDLTAFKDKKNKNG